MANKRYIAVLSVALIIGAGFIGLLSKGAAEPLPVLLPEQCINQYPLRPVVDGQCDNSDPACPETIDIDGGNCGEVTPPVVETPAPALKPVEPVQEAWGK